MQALCRAARDRGLVVEQLLVLLKDAWRRGTDVRELPRTSASDGLACLVTLCIRGCYEGADGTAGARAAPASASHAGDRRSAQPQQ